MISKLPLIDASFGLRDLIFAARKARHIGSEDSLKKMLSQQLHAATFVMTSSGIAAFYCLLEAMKRCSNRSEVVLPAYTAGSLVVAIKKAGLVPVLCDLDAGNVNAHADTYAASVTAQTLAVVPVHLFGIPVEGITTLRQKLPREVFCIEDCAQAMGTMVSGTSLGMFSDAAIFSFNRGKNLALGSGGYAHILSDELARVGVEGALSGQASAPSILTMAALSLAGNRFLYGLLYSFISRFKETAPPVQFPVSMLSEFHSALGSRVYPLRESFFNARFINGRQLCVGLADCPDITLPVIPSENRPAFNRFPVICRDASMRQRIKEALWSAGIESSPMYIRPLHHMFHLGYPPEAFPHAVALAERLLTLPVHPRVTGRDIDIMITIIRKIAGSLQ